MECHLYWYIIMIYFYCCCSNRLTKTIYSETKGTIIGADCGGGDLINEIGLVNRHKGKSSTDDLTVNESSATVPVPVPDPDLDSDPDSVPDLDSVPFPEENPRVIHCEGENMSVTLSQCGEPMHICQGIMTHLTNETFKELNEDNPGNNAGNNANNNSNTDGNEDDDSTEGPMIRQFD